MHIQYTDYWSVFSGEILRDLLIFCQILKFDNGKKNLIGKYNLAKGFAKIATTGNS